MKKILVTSKEFVVRNKKSIALSAALIGVIAVQRGELKAINSFLEEKNLLTEFYGEEVF